MLNFIYGFGSGILFLLVIILILAQISRNGVSWKAEKSLFEDRMYQYWEESIENNRDSAQSFREISESLQEIAKAIQDDRADKEARV
jgi:predicted acetyltransferase